MAKLTFFPLDEASSEVIFAPLHDPQIADQMDLLVLPDEGRGFALERRWCWRSVRWEGCSVDGVAGEIIVRGAVEPGRFDRLIVALNLPRDASLRVEIESGGVWVPLGAQERGLGHRIEPEWPLDGRPFEAVKLVFIAHNPGPMVAQMSWLGMADTTLRESVLHHKLPVDPEWLGLILPGDQWPGPEFGRNLLFSASDLPALRLKKESPLWKASWGVLESRAEELLSRSPEEDLADYLPFADIRYLRVREQGKLPYFWEPLTLAIVGLVNEQPHMIRHALQYLMCFVHTRHWCQSAESRLRGSTWDQRCFLEEMATSSCAILLDWLGWALTPRAADLVRQSIWDKGLAIVERDMMKHSYLLKMNQGSWFCRARILGGLMLEGAWPRMGSYVDRAMADLKEGLNNYMLPDGGTDEGVGYWSVTLTFALPAIIAHARARGGDPREAFPPQFQRTEKFISTLSAMEPGRVLMDGDNLTNRFLGDTIPILAALYPGSCYERIARAALPDQLPFNYTTGDGVFSFLLGPDSLPPATCIVPTFSSLDECGHLTSRRGRVRLHLSGCKASPSHSHADKGAFTLEIDGQPVLIDRGTVRYDDDRVALLGRTAMHNVITPVLPDGTFPQQAYPGQAVIPQGSGNEKSLVAEIDLTALWSEHMESCRRKINSPTPATFTVIDEVKMKAPCPIAFHLHARELFSIDGRSVTLAGKLRITADWAESIMQYEDLIDYNFQPVFHLVIKSAPCGEARLRTDFAVL